MTRARDHLASRVELALNFKSHVGFPPRAHPDTLPQITALLALADCRVLTCAEVLSFSLRHESGQVRGRSTVVF